MARLLSPLVVCLGLVAGGCAHGGAAAGAAGAPGKAKAAHAAAKPAPTATERAAATLARTDPATLRPVAPKAGEGVVHLACTPADAEVDVDGVTYGLVSDFDRPPYLKLTPGAHSIVLRKKGYEPYHTEVYLSGSVIETLTVSLTRRATAAAANTRETPP